LLTTFFACAALNATPVTFADRSLWLSSVANPVTATFDGPPPGQSRTYNSAAGLVIGDLRFVGYFSPTAYYLEVANPSATQPWYDWGSGAILRTDYYFPTYERRIKVDLLAAGTTAFGTDLMMGGVPGSPMTVRVNGIDTYEVETFARPGRSFFGLISETPITTVEFIHTIADSYPMIDNFSYGTASIADPASAVPEPGTATLALTGIIFVIQRKCRAKISR
jgi:hypothetical protein